MKIGDWNIDVDWDWSDFWIGFRSISSMRYMGISIQIIPWLSFTISRKRRKRN